MTSVSGDTTPTPEQPDWDEIEINAKWPLTRERVQHRLDLILDVVANHPGEPIPDGVRANLEKCRQQLQALER